MATTELVCWFWTILTDNEYLKNESGEDWKEVQIINLRKINMVQPTAYLWWVSSSSLSKMIEVSEFKRYKVYNGR
jgi:hypothetical protein